MALAVVPCHHVGDPGTIRKVPEIVERRLGNVLVVEEGLRVRDVAVLLPADVVLLAHVVRPIDALGEEAVRPMVVLRDGRRIVRPSSSWRFAASGLVSRRSTAADPRVPRSAFEGATARRASGGLA
jgi:hypothetical protein